VDDNKKKALNAALSQIEKQFGKGAVMRMGDSQINRDIDVVSTGVLTLDIALGIGGLPKGRVVEIYGPESSGKTTLTLQAIAECQKAGGTCAFVDAEHALDPGYAEKLGVDVDDMLVSQPDTGDQALEIVDMLVRSSSKRSNTLVIFINQIRMKIGVMFGSPETTTGGNALKFYSSVRLDIRRIGAIKKGDEVIGNDTRVKVVKNKMAPPFKQAEFEILYGEGSSREGELIELGVRHDMIDKAGAWYSYNGDRIGQGKDNVRNHMKEHPEMALEIETALRDKLLKPAGKKEEKVEEQDEAEAPEA